MSNALQISRGLWQLTLGTVNAYLLKTMDGLVLIDAGWPNHADAIFKAVQNAGHDPEDIRHLVLTHGHIDHAGSAAEVIRRTGARSYAHPADLDLINEGKAEHPGTCLTPGILPKLVYLLFIKPGGTTYKGFPVDQTLQDEEMLPMAPQVQVLHSPGHCAGHIALLLRDEGILIAGDICSNVMGLGYSILNEDRALARKSLLRVAEHSFERAVFGHGKSVARRANELLKERLGCKADLARPGTLRSCKLPSSLHQKPDRGRLACRHAVQSGPGRDPGGDRGDSATNVLWAVRVQYRKLSTSRGIPPRHVSHHRS